LVSARSSRSGLLLCRAGRTVHDRDFNRGRVNRWALPLRVGEGDLGLAAARIARDSHGALEAPSSVRCFQRHLDHDWLAAGLAGGERDLGNRGRGI